MAVRLRPATPLSIALFIAFVLLLLATISTPILKSIPLASVNGVTLGVFGYCEPSPGSCTGIQIGYTVGKWVPGCRSMIANSPQNPSRQRS